MKKIPLLLVAFTSCALLTGLLMTGCEDKINPVSATWRSWEKGDTVPGYVLSEPSGSRADVMAKAQMWDNYWALELAVDLNTGNQDDNIFSLGQDLVFALYISDGSDSIWNGSHLIHLVYKPVFVLPCDWSPDTVSVFDLKAYDFEPPTIDGDGGETIWSTLEQPEVKWETKLEISGAIGDNGLREAYIVAAHDSSKLYIKLAWPDPTGTKNMTKDMWHFDGHRWMQDGEEDMVVFFFPTAQAPASWDSLGGDTIDPESRLPMNGELNVWGWTAGRTNPLGYADDLLATPTELQGDNGTAMYALNYDPDKSYPPSVQNPAIEPSAGPEVLLDSEDVPFEETIRP